MIISQRLAYEMLVKNPKLLRKTPARRFKDDDGLEHVCNQVISVTWRWGIDEGTRDAEVYVSSQLDNKTWIDESGQKATLDLLVPKELDDDDDEEKELGHAVRPAYQLPPQTLGTLTLLFHCGLVANSK